LSDTLTNQNILKQDDDTTLYISYSLSPREIKKVHESKGKQKWNGTHQLLLYADDIILENINIINKNKKSFH
jgi:hypothetical protein